MDIYFGFALLVYCSFSLLLLRLIWIFLARINSRFVQLTGIWTLLVILFFPWLGVDFTGHIAPSIIVATFALLDSGFRPALQVLHWQALTWAFGLVLLWAVLRVFQPRVTASSEQAKNKNLTGKT